MEMGKILKFQPTLVILRLKYLLVFLLLSLVKKDERSVFVSFLVNARLCLRIKVQSSAMDE